MSSHYRPTTTVCVMTNGRGSAPLSFATPAPGETEIPPAKASLYAGTERVAANAARTRVVASCPMQAPGP